jgi:hypothetical protein
LWGRDRAGEGGKQFVDLIAGGSSCRRRVTRGPRAAARESDVLPGHHMRGLSLVLDGLM